MKQEGSGGFAAGGVLAVMIAFSAFLAYINFTNGHNWGDDFAAYVMQAKGLADGSPRAPVAANSFTNQHSSRPLGPDAYPWGYPLLLAAAYRFYGLNLAAMKALNIPFFAVFLLASYLLFRPRLSRPVALLGVGLLAFNPTLLVFQDNVLSDVPFLAVATVVLLLIDAAVSRGRTLLSPVADAAVIGLGAFVAVMIRTQGIVLLPSLLVAQIVAHRRRGPHEPAAASSSWLVRSLPYAAFGILYLLPGLFLPIGGAYRFSSMAGASLKTVTSSLLYYAALPADAFEWTPCGPIIYGCTLPFCLAGLAARGRHDAALIAYGLCTLCLVVAWPDRQGLRFLFPLMPVYVYFACHGVMTAGCFLASASQARKKRLAHLCLAAMVLVFVAAAVEVGSRNIALGRKAPGPFDAVSADMFHAVTSQTEPDSVLVFFKPRAMTLLTGRRSIMIDDAAQLDRGNYLVWHKSKTLTGYDQLSPELLASFAAAGRLQSMYDNAGFTLYRLVAHPPAESTPRE